MARLNNPNNPGTVYLIPTNLLQHFSRFLTRYLLPTLDFSTSAKTTSQLPPRQLYGNGQKSSSEFSSKTFYMPGSLLWNLTSLGGEIESINATSLFERSSKTMCRRGMRHFFPEPALAQNDPRSFCRR